MIVQVKSKPLDFGTVKIKKLALRVPQGDGRDKTSEGFLVLYHDSVCMLTIRGSELPTCDGVFSSEWRDVSLPGGKPVEIDSWEWHGPPDSVVGILSPLPNCNGVVDWQRA